MKLCVSVVLALLVALTWTRADPIPSPGPESEECSKLNNPMDMTQILGKFYFVMGFTDSDSLRPILNHTSSAWSNLTEIPTGVGVTNFYNLNGTCRQTRFNVTISGDTATALMLGASHEFKLLNLSSTSLIMLYSLPVSNRTDLFEKPHLKQQMDQNVTQGPSDVSAWAHIYYLISRQRNVSEIDLEQFKVHAKCAGFDGEPDYFHKNDQEYCTEEESVSLNR